MNKGGNVLERHTALFTDLALPVQAKHTEKKRYDASGGRHPNGKAMSKRPDTKARTRMAAEGRNCHKGKLAGHVPGHQLNQRSVLLCHPW